MMAQPTFHPRRLAFKLGQHSAKLVCAASNARLDANTTPNTAWPSISIGTVEEPTVQVPAVVNTEPCRKLGENYFEGLVRMAVTGGFAHTIISS